MSVGQLLFPCCAEQVPLHKQGGGSLAAQVITALVLAVILGVGAALATYCLTQGAMMWTVVGGGVGMVVAAPLFYVALRCLYGQKSPEIPHVSPVPVPVISTMEAQSHPVASPVHSSPVPAQSAAVLPSPSSNRGVVSKPGMDPTNGLPLSPLQAALRTLLSDVSRPEVARQFVGELDQMCRGKVSQYELRCIVRYFAPYEVRGLAMYAQNAGLKAFLAAYGLNADQADQRAIYMQQGLTEQLNSFLREGHWYFGTAHPDESSFFHTAAQLLSAHLGRCITEKMVRQQCQTHMERENLQQYFKGDYKTASLEVVLSSQDCENLPRRPLRGFFNFHGRILTEHYGVQFGLVEAPEIPDEELMFECELSALQIAKPFKEVAMIDQERRCIMAVMGNHYFPVWTRD